MQNAKDTFYLTLRDRLVALNPNRTMVLHGVTRPGLLVEENELISALQPADVFCMRWAGLKVSSREVLPLVSMECEIRYCTDGSAASTGMDRGRLLSAMDAELSTALNTAPQNAAKSSFTSGVADGTAMTSNVFWSDVLFGAVEMKEERLERVAKVEVFAYQETGEL